jgi:hypothetical protein
LAKFFTLKRALGLDFKELMTKDHCRPVQHQAMMWNVAKEIDTHVRHAERLKPLTTPGGGLMTAC